MCFVVPVSYARRDLRKEYKLKTTVPTAPWPGDDSRGGGGIRPWSGEPRGIIGVLYSQVDKTKALGDIAGEAAKGFAECPLHVSGPFCALIVMATL